MPYRVDIAFPPSGGADTLIELGALDVEQTPAGLAAVMPDAVAADTVEAALAPATVRVSAAVGRDDGSVWTLAPSPVHVGGLTFMPATAQTDGAAIQLADGPAFGTGLHPTTALCLEAIAELIAADGPARMLDVGTGSGILALAALRFGVAQVTGVEVDADALAVAAENAALNGVADRLTLLRGGPDVVDGMWPFVVANIRAGELMALAPVLTRRVASGGTLVLSGIPQSAAGEVEQSYRRLGMTTAVVTERDGWVALALRPSW